MNSKKQRILGQVLNKIPLFNRVSPSNVREILSACQMVQFKAGEKVFEQGELSHNMIILISGEMAVLSDDGVKITTISPIATIGEMGMLLRDKRSATVTAVIDCLALDIKGQSFEAVLEKKPNLKKQIHLNLIAILSGKIFSDNSLILDYDRERLNMQIAVHQLQKQLEFALSIIAEKTDMSTEQVRDVLEERKINKMVILFVDDEKSYHSSVQRLLRNQPCEIIFAEGGEDALSQLDQYQVDLVISDLRMAPMDGYKLAEEIGNRFPNLPVFALSAIARSDYVVEQNFEDFISKPIELKDFRMLIESFFEESS